ncbi:PWI domain-containing protein [Sporormia fimetaria CBS 119925]|uniref:PWI domain-containing protein n=1 Tax=Sporormia fimetaria CBS 119925 TaxID=1340428 RepID=A0A6A6VM59_9PLEO|nr:PWI domain-containing protein [Sporormia fimetaria CBS 119925]
MALTVDQKRLRATKFPPEFDQKVDLTKVNTDVMKVWIAARITEILGDEDDVVVETCFNLLEQDRYPKIKEIQIQLEGFLNKECAAFCKDLWNKMLDAQNNETGVPKDLLEAKKMEILREQANRDAAESRRKQAREETDMLNSIRENDCPDRPDRGERGDRFGRSNRGGRDTGFRDNRDRGGRGRDGDRFAPRRHSRSPPRRRRSPPPPRRDQRGDTWYPPSGPQVPVGIDALALQSSLDLPALVAIDALGHPHGLDPLLVVESVPSQCDTEPFKDARPSPCAALFDFIKVKLPSCSSPQGKEQGQEWTLGVSAATPAQRIKITVAVCVKIKVKVQVKFWVGHPARRGSEKGETRVFTFLQE